MKPFQVAVIGASGASADEKRIAETVGILLADCGVTMLSGGKGGVMEESCRGCLTAGGTVAGILPDHEGNPYLSVIIRTGMEQARNVILIRSADAVIAVGGGYGTLSEIAHALSLSIPVFGIQTWKIPGVEICLSAQEAVERAAGVRNTGMITPDSILTNHPI